MKTIDPWKVLRVSPGDTVEFLKQAYKQVMLTAHPDREGGSEEAACDVNRAYDFLRHNLVDGRVPSPEQVGIARPTQRRNVVHLWPVPPIAYSPYATSTSTTSTWGAFGNAAPFVVFVRRG